MGTVKNPVITEQVNYSATKGIYAFYTKSCTKLFLIVHAILNNLTDATKRLNSFAYLQLVSCLWIVNHTANKLEGICSISSSVHDNLFCKCRQLIKDCICKYCYAYKQQAYQTGLKEHNIINGLILKNILLPISVLKHLVIVFPYLRIEAFGDVENVTQARNYLRIIKAFPDKRCAIWSKNISVWENAIDIEGKPKNITYVHSSSFINKIDEIDLERYSFVDHVFTVFTKAYVKKNNIIINCGGKKCINCIKEKKNCYFRNTEFYINELKK